MILKNVAGQGVYLLAYHADGSADSGDAANITGSISKDGGVPASAATANPTPIGGPLYWQPLSQAESNADAISIIWTSSTSGVAISPFVGYTSGANLPVAAPGASGGISTYQGGAVASVSSPVIVGTNADKAGYSLAPSGLDQIAATAPTHGTLGSWTFPQMLMWLVRRLMNRATRTPTTITLYADDATTTLTTQAISDDGSGNESQGAAT